MTTTPGDCTGAVNTDEFSLECTPWKALSILAVAFMVLLIIWQLCCRCYCSKRKTVLEDSKDDENTQLIVANQATQTKDDENATKTTAQDTALQRELSNMTAARGNLQTLVNDLQVQLQSSSSTQSAGEQPGLATENEELKSRLQFANTEITDLGNELKQLHAETLASMKDEAEESDSDSEAAIVDNLQR